MKRVFKILEPVGLLFFVILIIWSEQIQAYSKLLHFFMFLILVIGLASSMIHSRLERDKRIADNAVKRYKADNRIAD